MPNHVTETRIAVPTPTWTLTRDDAHRLLDAAERVALERNLQIAIAVVNAGGHLVALRRMDNTKDSSAVIATQKGWTAAIMRRKSGDYQASVQPGGESFGLLNLFPGEIVPVPGGVPIHYRHELVGGLGITGGSPEEDEEIATLIASEFDGSGQEE